MTSEGQARQSRLTLLLATRNGHKVRELRYLLRDSPVRLISLEHFPGIRPVKEDGATFEANAVKKAVAASRRTILPVLAEDSGIEVRALGGQPGVRSARFAGPDQDGAANNAKLLGILGNVPGRRRQARYACVMALAAGGRVARIFRGTCAGSIALRPAGRGGFGYDPIFVPRGYRKTMAQLSSGEKNRVSHRGQAARRLARWLRSAR